MKKFKKGQPVTVLHAGFSYVGKYAGRTSKIYEEDAEKYPHQVKFPSVNCNGNISAEAIMFRDKEVFSG